MPSSKTYLVTGVAGFIASQVASALLDQGHTVIGIDNLNDYYDVSLKQEYGGAEYPDPFIIDIEKYLKEGDNTISFELINYAKPDAVSPEDNPAGLIYRLHVEYRD